MCMPIADPDLWWHITVGRWIIAHREVPVVDHWNLFGVGQPWRAYSWSNEVIYAWVDQVWGDKGLALARLCLGLLFVGALQYIFGLLAGSYFIGALLGVFTALACIGHFSLRPQTVVWILYAASIAVVDRACLRGVKKSLLCVLFTIGCVWANTHVSSILGVAAVLLWGFGSSADTRSVWRSCIFGICFVLGSLVSPYWGGEWLSAFETSTHTMQFNSIDEFKPATIVQYSSGFVLMQVALLLVLCFASRRLPPLNRVLLLVVMLLLGCAIVKFIPFTTITLSAVLAVWWRDMILTDYKGQDSNRVVEGLVLLERRVMGLQAATLGALGFFMACLAWITIVKMVRQPVDYTVVPKSSVDFIQSKGLTHPILNQFGAGGYLMYRFSSARGEPLQLVTLDGRTNVNRADVWKKHERAMLGRENWEEYVRVVQPRTILWRQDSALVAILLASPEWCRIFQSGGKATDHSVFIARDEFERRRSDFESDDCGQ